MWFIVILWYIDFTYWYFLIRCTKLQTFKRSGKSCRKSSIVIGCQETANCCKFDDTNTHRRCTLVTIMYRRVSCAIAKMTARCTLYKWIKWAVAETWPFQLSKMAACVTYVIDSSQQQTFNIQMCQSKITKKFLSCEEQQQRDIWIN